MNHSHKKDLFYLANLFLSLHSTDNLAKLLDGLLTPQEVEQLNKRIEIVKRLKAGESQRKIARDLKVGLATVTRGAKEVKLGKFAPIKIFFGETKFNLSKKIN